MATFGPADDLNGASSATSALRGARFVGVSLSGAVIRGSDVDGLEIDSPWLLEGPGTLVVNGVDVAPFVDSEARPDASPAGRCVGPRTPTARVPRGPRSRAPGTRPRPRSNASRPVPSRCRSTATWSFAQTLRHLVLATDLWLGQAVLGLDKPFHPLGLTNIEAADEGFDMSVLTDVPPTYDEVLAARASRVALVRGFLATATQETFDVPRRNPWATEHVEHAVLRRHDPRRGVGAPALRRARRRRSHPRERRLSTRAPSAADAAGRSGSRPSGRPSRRASPRAVVGRSCTGPRAPGPRGGRAGSIVPCSTRRSR